MRGWTQRELDKHYHIFIACECTEPTCLDFWVQEESDNTGPRICENGHIVEEHEISLREYVLMGGRL